MKNASRRKKSRLINLFVAIVSHNKNNTTNSQDRPMVLIAHSRKSQNPIKNKGFAPGTFLGYRFITIAKVRLNASCCFQIDTRMRFLVSFIHNQLTASGVTRENEATPFLYPDAPSWFCVDTRARVKIFYKHNRFLVSSALRSMRAALFFVLSQIVNTQQATDDRRISRVSVRLHA
ncbi:MULTISPECIES: hypothetical protein [Acetobacter]|uniref:hypothetical protein n=1 Tax=Acetobacter TaxID=434 RepID=UPI001FC99B5E|nr:MULTISPECIES: hypothetical protein [Acetobacter]